MLALRGMSGRLEMIESKITDLDEKLSKIVDIDKNIKDLTNIESKKLANIDIEKRRKDIIEYIFNSLMHSSNATMASIKKLANGVSVYSVQRGMDITVAIVEDDLTITVNPYGSSTYFKDAKYAVGAILILISSF